MFFIWSFVEREVVRSSDLEMEAGKLRSFRGGEGEFSIRVEIQYTEEREGPGNSFESSQQHG